MHTVYIVHPNLHFAIMIVFNKFVILMHDCTQLIVVDKNYKMMISEIIRHCAI